MKQPETPVEITAEDVRVVKACVLYEIKWCAKRARTPGEQVVAQKLRQVVMAQSFESPPVEELSDEEREAAAHVADFVNQTLIWKRRRGSPAERAAARRLRDRLAPVLSRFKANPPPLERAS